MARALFVVSCTGCSRAETTCRSHSDRHCTRDHVFLWFIESMLDRAVNTFTGLTDPSKEAQAAEEVYGADRLEHRAET